MTKHIFNEAVVRDAAQRLALQIATGKAVPFHDETGKLTTAGKLASVYAGGVAREDLMDGNTDDAENDPVFSTLLNYLNTNRVEDAELAEVGA